MACVCSHDVNSDWLTLGHYSPVMPIGPIMGLKEQSQKPYKKKTIYQLQTFTDSLNDKNVKPQLACPVNTSLSVDKK